MVNGPIAIMDPATCSYTSGEIQFRLGRSESSERSVGFVPHTLPSFTRRHLPLSVSLSFSEETPLCCFLPTPYCCHYFWRGEQTHTHIRYVVEVILMFSVVFFSFFLYLYVFYVSVACFYFCGGFYFLPLGMGDTCLVAFIAWKTA